MDFSRLLDEFVKIDAWISLSSYMDLSKLTYGFLNNLTWTLQSCWVDLLKLLRGFAKHILCISPFTKQNQAEV